MPRTATRHGARLLHAAIEALESRRLLATTFTVNTNADAGPGSYRQALLDSNATPGRDTIAFNLPITDLASRNINLLSEPPDITDPLTIDGTTQPNWGGTHTVQIVGAFANAQGHRITSTAPGCIVKGLAFFGFASGFVAQSSGHEFGGIDAGNVFYGHTHAALDLTSAPHTLARGNSIYDSAAGILRSINAPAAPVLTEIYRDSEGLFIRGRATAEDDQSLIVDFYALPFNRNPGEGGHDSATYLGSETVPADDDGGTVFFSELLRPLRPPGHGALIYATVSDLARHVTSPTSAMIQLITAPFQVLNTADSGPGSLRQALLDAAGSSVARDIEFLIPGATDQNPARILLSSALPPVPPNTSLIHTAFNRPYSIQLERHPAAPRDFDGLTLNGNTLVSSLRITGFRDGIRVLSGTNNRIRKNLIHDNAGLPINLGVDGPTPNDPGDIDTGPNDLQNAPIITSIQGEGYAIVLNVSLSSQPDRAYDIDLFAGPANTDTRYSLGAVFINTGSNGSGNTFGIIGTQVTIPHGWRVSATATDAQTGNTSEFGAPFTFTGNRFAVINTSDAGPGSLRQAILDTNAAPGTQIISFFLNTTNRTIALQSPLPVITDPVTLDGATYLSFSSERPILIAPTSAANIDGITLTAGNSTVRALEFTGFRNAIVIDSSNNTIGGTSTANILHHNTADGIRVLSGVGNRLAGNIAYANGGLAIDLGGDGPTANDALDTDTGANALSNAPVLTIVQRWRNTLTIEGTLDALPDTNYAVNLLFGPPVLTQNSIFVPAQSITTDVLGHATFRATLTQTMVNTSWQVTAIATDAAGNSSEIAAPINVTSPPFVVTSIADSGPGSFRQAIMDANAAPGSNLIRFDVQLTGAPGEREFQLLSALPPITGPTGSTLIDGSTQDGYTANNPLWIRGPSNGAAVHGLVLQFNANSILGLRLSGFRHAIVVQSHGNLIGTSAAPLHIHNNTGDAVRILSGDANRIRGNRFYNNGGMAIDLGGDGPTANDPTDADTGANLLLNAPVITSVDRDPTGFVVHGRLQTAPNTIFRLDFYRPQETSPTNTAYLGSAGTLRADASGLSTWNYVIPPLLLNQTIIAAATDNLDNTSEYSAPFVAAPLPVLVTNASDSGPGSLRQAMFDANYFVGHDTIHFALPSTSVSRINLNSALPGALDLTIDAATQPGYAGKPIIEIVGQTNFAGFTVAGAIIRGFAIGGFSTAVSLIQQSTLSASYIGLGANGAAIPNVTGVYFDGFGNRIGGATAADRNVISGNLGAGIFSKSNSAATGPAHQTKIEGNFIGTDITGKLAIPNEIGIHLRTYDAFVGGLSAAAGNVISGNRTFGLYINEDLTQNYADVVANYIGVDATGTNALGNQIGVVLEGRTLNVGTGNIISGNTSHGVLVRGYGVIVFGNFIGVDANQKPVPNGGDGIRVQGGAMIGGVGHDKNLIAHNAGAGIRVLAPGTVAAAAWIRQNSIHSNGQLGIDNGPLGVTPNDPGDADTGDSLLTNFPILSAATRDALGLRVTGSFNTRPNTPIMLDFYASPTADASTHGEGMIHLKHVEFRTNATGSGNFDLLMDIGVPAAWKITATLSASVNPGTTYDNPQTSEFSPVVTVTDTVRPTVVSARFVAPRQIAFVFSEDLGPLTPAALAVKNSANQTLTPQSVAFDLTSNTATFAFADPLPDDFYTATLLAPAVADPSDNTLAENYAFNFFNLRGDTNGDGEVGFIDLLTVAANFGKSPATFAQGDFDGDNRVGFTDLLTTSSRFGVSIGAPPVPTAAALSSKSTKKPVPVFAAKPIAARKPARR